MAVVSKQAREVTAGASVRTRHPITGQAVTKQVLRVLVNQAPDRSRIVYTDGTQDWLPSGTSIVSVVT